MTIKMKFNLLGTLLLLGLFLLTTGCHLLKKNVDNVELSKFRVNNQTHIDSLVRYAARSAALGIADTAQLITKNLILGLKGSMDTLDPDFQKLKLKIEELGSLSEAQLAKLGNQLELRVKNLKDDIKDEELKKFLISIIEESTGKLKAQTRTMLSDMIQNALNSFDAETAKEKLQVIISGALGDSTKIKAQELVSGALRPTVDTILARIEKIVRKDVPFVQRQANKLLVALAALSAAIIGWVWYQRRRYAKLVSVLTYEIDKIPSQTLYDELTKRIRNEAQKNELEPLLRQVLKDQGVNS
ncbi:MAG: hypothetical protein ACKVT2_21680 [Saprospiraceae bacterium]